MELPSGIAESRTWDMRCFYVFGSYFHRGRKAMELPSGTAESRTWDMRCFYVFDSYFHGSRKGGSAVSKSEENL